MIDHSQHGETSWILENLKPEVGTFCEVGAYDGVMSSNTYLLEQLGWTGVLVEADPYLAAQCQESRKCPTLCCAAGFEGLWWFSVNRQDRGLSKLGEQGNGIPVVGLRLGTILEKFHLWEPTILSIDVEGSELMVWDSMGIATFKPRIVIMEYRTCDEPPNDMAIVERMTRDGYKEVHRTACNLIFEKV